MSTAFRLSLAEQKAIATLGEFERVTATADLILKQRASQPKVGAHSPDGAWG